VNKTAAPPLDSHRTSTGIEGLAEILEAAHLRGNVVRIPEAGRSKPRPAK
jgi:hypothetical protein